MGNYEDDAKVSFIGVVGLVLTILILILIEKC
jgi:hypothetical protein